MDIPQLGIHIPTWLVWLATFAGIALSAYMTDRNTKRTQRLSVSVDNQVSRITELFTQQQTGNQALMQMVLDAKNGDIKELRDSIKTLEKDLDGYKTLTETQATDLFKQSSNMRSLENLLGTAKKDLNESIEKHTREIKRLSEQAADKDQLIADKDEELERRAQEILALTTRLKDYVELEKRVTTLQADVDQLKKDIEVMNMEKAQLQQRVEELTAERDAADKRAVQAEKRATQAERERDEAVKALETSKRSTSDLDTVITPVKATTPVNGFATPDPIAQTVTKKTGALPELKEPPSAQ